MSFETLEAVLSDEKNPPISDELRAFILSEHVVDLAHFISGLELNAAWKVLDILPVEEQAKVFGYLNPECQVGLASLAKRDRMPAIITAMDADDRADLFNNLSEAQRDALIPALSQAEREDIRRLSSYEEGTAGAIMTSDYAVLTAELTVRQALDKLRLEAPDKETIYRAYVIDDQRRLIGSVRLRELILKEPETRIVDAMQGHPIAVTVDDHQEEVAQKIARYDVLALPVVDGEGRLVGIVTHDDAIDVLQEEATEDFHRVGTVGKLTVNVRDAGIALLYRKRIVWLVLLVFANIFSGAGIAYYEDTIAAYVALVFFLPLLIDSGGNAGSQSATLMVRALATGDVVMKDWGRMFVREVTIALLLGLTMAVAVSLIGIYRGGPEIAMVVSMTMVLVVLAGSLIGLSLPFILSRLNFDPATASAPLITSISDIVGVLIYFSIATAFLLPGG